VSHVDQPEAASPSERSAVLLEASRNPRLAARVMLDSYMRNLEFRAELTQIRRASFSAALRRQQEVVQDMLEQAAATESRTPAQRDALIQGLERRLAAIRNFAEVTEASNRQFFEAADRRMADWCAEIRRSMLGIENGATG
jgi:hypothetical protein